MNFSKSGSSLLMAGVACILSVLTVVAYAKAPDGVSDLVGARAAGAESQIQARGYENIKKNIWWNEETKTCVKVRVSNGRYASIDGLKAQDCGKVASKNNKEVKITPAFSIANTAVTVCMKSADAFQNVAAGTSVVDEVVRSGSNWLLTMASGTYRSKCTVTSSGKELNIEPI